MFFLTNLFQCYLSLNVWCVCVCVCVYVCVCVLFITLFLSVLFVFHWKNSVSLHLINRYMTSTSEQFLKRKDILESKFLVLGNYSFNLIQTAAVSS